MIATCPNCKTDYTVADEKIPETGAQMKCPKCNTMIVVHRTPAVELIPEPLVQPAQVPSTPSSSTQISPRSKKSLVYIIAALVWIGLSAKIPVFGIIANIPIAVLTAWIFVSAGLRQKLWGFFNKKPPSSLPVVYGATVLMVALVSILASVDQLRESFQDADRIEEQKLAKANWEKKKEEDWKRRNSAKRKKFEKFLSEAKELAQDQSRVEEAVSAFNEADGLGDLSKDDAVLFSDLLRSVGENHFKTKNYSDAFSTLEKAKELNPDIQGIDKLLAKAERMKRREDVKDWIDLALTVSGDKNLCDTAKEIAEAWDKLQNVNRKDSLYGRAKVAAKKLERCRKKVIREVVKAGLALMRNQRSEMAKKLEVLCLDQGMDVRVVLLGKNKDRMKIIYILFNRAWAHKMTEGGSMAEGSFLANLQKIGFKRVTFSNGYDSSFYYDLKPENEVKAFSKTLDGMGLGDPLKL